MFDIGASELLVIIIVAVLVIGPKDMPLALRTAGRWIGKIRRVSAHFRTGLDAMVREAELEEMEKKWKEQNAAIMARSGPAADAGSDADDPPLMEGPPAESAGRAEAKAPVPQAAPPSGGRSVDAEPQLPLGSSDKD